MEGKFSSEMMEAMDPGKIPGKFRSMVPEKFRSVVRCGEWKKPNLNVCQGYAQANLAIVPKEYAFEFLLFCKRNPSPCPVLDVTEPGNPHPELVAPSADLRTDLPRYRVYQNGMLIDEPFDIVEYWRSDLVAFLIGCSASFDWSMRAANVSFRLLGAYTSNIQCVPAGRFHGPIVVSCRLVKNGNDVIRAILISSRLSLVHGPPLHIGDPSMIGIRNLYKPEYPGYSDNIAPQAKDEVALFWGCGVTPQKIAVESKIPFMITHYPAHMFITDRLTEELAT